MPSTNLVTLIDSKTSVFRFLLLGGSDLLKPHVEPITGVPTGRNHIDCDWLARHGIKLKAERYFVSDLRKLNGYSGRLSLKPSFILIVDDKLHIRTGRRARHGHVSRHPVHSARSIARRGG